MSGLRRLTLAVIVMGLLSGGDRSSHPFARETRSAQTADVASVVRAIVDIGRGSSVGSRTLAEQQQLTALYGAQSYIPLWVDGSGRASRDAREALALLRGATSEGLEPLDYDAATLQEFAARLGGADAPGAGDIARFDVALSVNTLRYFQHLHFGRVDPGAVGFRMSFHHWLLTSDVLEGCARGCAVAVLSRRGVQRIPATLSATEQVITRRVSLCRAPADSLPI